MTSDIREAIIEVASNNQSISWEPSRGTEFLSFVERKVPSESKDALSTTTHRILSSCVSPHGDPDANTGLVVGHVQSGKTMSFEGVAALARDNGFQLVVLIGGTSKPLLAQSTDRMVTDLRVGGQDQSRVWRAFASPRNDAQTAGQLRSVFSNWRNPTTPDFLKQSVLVTVLKHHKRIHDLARLLGKVGANDTPTIIIDDEADQASLNADVRKNDTSSTYRAILALRGALRHHTYLQYTATPQAPLLISISDALAPDFVHVLTPGSAYVGGNEFFSARGRRQYVRSIPQEDIPSKDETPIEPPQSLLEALAIYVIGVAMGMMTDRATGNRSMLVHPSQRIDQHGTYIRWVESVLRDWRACLELPAEDPDRQDVLTFFGAAWKDLRATVEDIPSMAELAPWIGHALNNVNIVEVNARAGSTPAIAWDAAYSWILVGGQALDRGYTVEGLTVTYMPRSVGVGNADTVQQRARFFGYKRSYLGLCRVFLEDAVLDAFVAYTDHEEDVRRQLRDVEEARAPLSAWKRAFILDRRLKPCRQSVMSLDYAQGTYSDSWYYPNAIAFAADAVVHNRGLIKELSSSIEFVEDSGHQDRTEMQRHYVASSVKLLDVLESLLVPFRVAGPRESERYLGLLLQLERALEADANEEVVVYLMSRGRTRSRSVDTKTGRISSELFQGAHPDRSGAIYPGDRQIRSHEQVSIQIHSLSGADLPAQSDSPPGVPVLAVWVPSRLGAAWFVQKPGAQ